MKVKDKSISNLTIEGLLEEDVQDNTRPKRIECGVTENSSLFKPYFAQRPLDEARCKKMSKEMKKYGNFSAVQCIKDGQFLYVWDGQHVLKAATLAGLSINYDIYDCVPKYILSIKNSNTKSWSLGTTHDYFLKMEDKVAHEVQDFIMEVSQFFRKPIRLTAALKLLSGVYSNQSYRDRDYIVNNKKNAYDVVSALRDISKYVDFATDSKFVTSFQLVYNCGLYEHSFMKKRLPKGFMNLHSQLKILHIVKGIQKCYNNGINKAKRVDFVTACNLQELK